MTDPEIADRTYIEPLSKEYLEAIIAAERPDALLPTVGGQTGLNLAVELAESGILAKYEVELIGASLHAIKIAEDRLLFKDVCRKIGLEVPASAVVTEIPEAIRLADQLGYPVVIRPSFTLGGTGGSIAYNHEEFADAIARALDASPVRQALIEESVIGWKEFELEVMRDVRDNFVVICSIENFDPMGIHTGRFDHRCSRADAHGQGISAHARRGCRHHSRGRRRNRRIEHSVWSRPGDGRMVVIEMNPRVSRSSALASKATGFPIAKIAAKLAVGMTLDEIPNDITRMTPSCFEPTIDYVVAKIPKFQFEKFPGSETTLTTQMKSVGEVMAMGRTFQEALCKAIRALEPSTAWRPPPEVNTALLREKLHVPGPDRLHWLFEALERGMSREEVCDLTKIDPWFIRHLEEMLEVDSRMAKTSLRNCTSELMLESKRSGASDEEIAKLWNVKSSSVRARRHELGVVPVFKRVDTCAAEFESFTPYMYSTYEEEDESAVGGPPENRDSRQRAEPHRAGN